MGNNKQWDIYPQFLRMKVVESAANTFTEEEYPTAVPVHQGPGKVLVMNVLKIIINLGTGDMADGDIIQASIYDRTRTEMPGNADSGVLIYAQRTSKLTTEGAHNYQDPVVLDLSDGNGHGILFARKNIYIAVKGTSQANPMTCVAQVVYTLAEISTEEYIGIAQD